MGFEIASQEEVLDLFPGTNMRPSPKNDNQKTIRKSYSMNGNDVVKICGSIVVHTSKYSFICFGSIFILSPSVIFPFAKLEKLVVFTD